MMILNSGDLEWFIGPPGVCRFHLKNGHAHVNIMRKVQILNYYTCIHLNSTENIGANVYCPDNCDYRNYFLP